LNGKQIFIAELDVLGNYRWHSFFGSNYNDTGYDIDIGTDGRLTVGGQAEDSFDGPEGEAPLHDHYPDGYALSDLVVLSFGP
jgi:hypothetical protein